MMSDSFDCLFCKIIAGEIPSDKVYSDQSVYAFNDIDPKAKVHVLVVSKKHYPNVDAVANDDPRLLAHMVQVAQGIADKAYGGDFRLVFNTGERAGQSIFHVHAHMLSGEDMTSMPMAAADGR